METQPDHLSETQQAGLAALISETPMSKFDLLRSGVLHDLLDVASPHMVERIEVPVIGKRYEDRFLRPPNKNLEERACVLGSSCMCNLLAQARGIPDMGFTGVEFLLPAQSMVFVEHGRLPAVHGKCLVCIRYMTTKLLSMARADERTRAMVCSLPIQGHSNQVCQHASKIDCKDGYARSAVIFPDLDFAKINESWRHLAMRPVVKFVSANYVYYRTAGKGTEYLVQQGVTCQLNDEPL